MSDRKEAELRERNRNIVLEAVVSMASVEEVLAVLVRVLEEEEPSARIRFMLVDGSGKFLVNSTSSSIPKFFLEHTGSIEIGVENGAGGSAAARLAPVVTDDVASDPAWESLRELAHVAEIRACCSVPILGSSGLLLGTLDAYFRKPRRLSEKLVRRITAAADFAALAIERKNAEIAARNREMLLQSMGEIGTMGAWEIDLTSGVRTWTDELNRIHGLDSGSPQPDVLSLYTEDSRNRLMAGIKKGMETGEPWTMDLELTTPGGRHVWLRSEGRAQWVDGKITRLFGAAQDITALKQAESEFVKLQEQLLHAQKMESIGRLAGGVAHDFNNIVSVILGHAELAMEYAPKGSALMGDLNEIRLAAERSATLTQQLLAFARKQPRSPMVVNVNDTIAGMVNMLRRLIGGEIALSWESDPDLWSVFIDPAQIDQILANLCVNARDAIGTRGVVKISTTNTVVDSELAAVLGDCEPGPFVCLSVSDDGSGVQEDILENIFEPFFTTKGVGMGTGLGLATVYGIVKQNGGGIRVENQSKGTRFDLYFPRALDAYVPTDHDILDQKPSRQFSTVLLVDDEPMVLNVTTRLLEGLGHEVRAALGPTEAIRIAAEMDHIDVLLTDVIMPEMNGKDLSLLLAASHPEMSVVLMSGYTAEVLKGEGVFQETFFLQKPFSLSELREVMMDALNFVI